MKFYNSYHLGDCLLSSRFLNKLSTVVGNLEFSCNPDYHSQLTLLDPRVRLNSNGGGINLWGHQPGCYEVTLPYRFSARYPHLEDVGAIVYTNFKLLSSSLGYPDLFTSKQDVIFDEEIFNLGNYSKYDYLLINSHCLSGQMNISHHSQDLLFERLANTLQHFGKKVITTRKIDGFESTGDYNLNVTQIGQLSKFCKVVLGVPTAPFWTAINKYAIDSGARFINFTHDICTFDYGEQFETISDLNNYIDTIK